MRAAVDGSTLTMAAASALDTSGTGCGEPSIRALSEADVSTADVGRFVLTGSDPPFLTESHQMLSPRLYPGPAVANAEPAIKIKSLASGASQDPDHSPQTPISTPLALGANPRPGTACRRASPPAATKAGRRA